MSHGMLVAILGIGIALVGFALSWAEPRPGRTLRPLRALLGIALIFAGLVIAALASRSMR